MKAIGLIQFIRDVVQGLNIYQTQTQQSRKFINIDTATEYVPANKLIMSRRTDSITPTRLATMVIKLSVSLPVSICCCGWI